MKRKSFSVPVAIALACLVAAGCDKPQIETPADVVTDSTTTPAWDDTITIRISFGESERTRAFGISVDDEWSDDYNVGW